MRVAFRNYLYISAFLLCTLLFSITQVSAQAETPSEIGWEKEIQGRFDGNLEVSPVINMEKAAPSSKKVASKLIVDNESIQIRDKEEPVRIKAKVVYKDGTEEDVTTKASWSSNQSSIAYVDNGYVYGQNLGAARVTVNYLDFSKTITVQVVPFPEIEYIHAVGGLESEKGENVFQVSKDEFLIAGVKGDIEEKGYLAKVNKNGRTLWEKTFCWKENGKCVGKNSFHHILKTTDKGFLLLGVTNDVRHRDDIYLVKTNSNGKMIWQNKYGEDGLNDFGASLIEVADGYIMVGWNMIRKIDKTGRTIWRKKINPDGYGSYYSAIAIEDGFLVAGSGVITKTDQNGNKVWTKEYPIQGEFKPLRGGNLVSLEVTPDSLLKMIMVGPDGNTKWEKEYAHDTDYYRTIIIPTNDNGFAFSEVTSRLEFRLTTYDESGNQTGRIAFNPDVSESLFWSLIQTKDGGFLFTGYEYADSVDHMVTSDALLVKLFPLNH